MRCRLIKHQYCIIYQRASRLPLKLWCRPAGLWCGWRNTQTTKETGYWITRSNYWSKKYALIKARQRGFDVSHLIDSGLREPKQKVTGRSCLWWLMAALEEIRVFFFLQEIVLKGRSGISVFFTGSCRSQKVNFDVRIVENSCLVDRNSKMRRFVAFRHQLDWIIVHKLFNVTEKIRFYLH